MLLDLMFYYFILFYFNFFFFFFNVNKAFAYEPSRRLVVRMDLLPHNHCINFVRIGSFGKLYNKIVRIEDLEYVEYEEL
jgi:hypothetical protein